MEQEVSTSQQYDLSKWSCQPLALHHNHGKSVQLSENDSVAKRKYGFRNAMVFTAGPVPIGGILQLTLLRTDERLVGGLVSPWYGNSNYIDGKPLLKMAPFLLLHVVKFIVVCLF